MQYKIFFLIIFSIIFAQSALAGEVLVLRIEDAITPAISLYIENGISEAMESGCDLIIIKLNTPGGLLDATRQIVSQFLESEIPIIVYVSPGGSRAGSAGVFITMAAHIAVMAPGTNIGAAHPVGIDGSSDSTVMGQKIENDAAAFIRTIAEKRNRNRDWAENAVRHSVSITENEALDSNVIDLIAPNIDSLLKAVNNTEIKLKNGKVVILHTQKSKITMRDMNFKENLLALLGNPNIAYIFILLGIWGIIFELKSPGAIFPGVVGAISLLIAAYSLQMLPVNYIGLGLIILSIILFIMEIFIQSYALLTVGGIICFALGSVMLIDSPEDIMVISTQLIIFATIFTALFFGMIIWFGIRAQARRKAPIASDMEGLKGIAITDISSTNKGKVHLNGEIWIAQSDDSIMKNDTVIVVKIIDFTLFVKKSF